MYLGGTLLVFFWFGGTRVTKGWEPLNSKPNSKKYLKLYQKKKHDARGMYISNVISQVPILITKQIYLKLWVSYRPLNQSDESKCNFCYLSVLLKLLASAYGKYLHPKNVFIEVFLC